MKEKNSTLIIGGGDHPHARLNIKLRKRYASVNLDLWSTDRNFTEASIEYLLKMLHPLARRGKRGSFWSAGPTFVCIYGCLIEDVPVLVKRLERFVKDAAHTQAGL